MKKKNSYEYDVALSFAGEDRAYVEKVADNLNSRGIKVFYDLFEEANLWGKNLYEYLSEIYQNKARYTILFISNFYNQKLWTNHERASMQVRAFQESREYILPARFDDTEIPGILTTIGYVDLQNKTPEDLALLVEKKLNRDQTFLRRRWSKLTTMINPKPFIFSIKLVNQDQNPVANAHVVLVANNATYLEAFTDQSGVAHLIIRTRKVFTMCIAHASYPAIIFKNINPKDDIKVVIEKNEGCGSKILNKSGTLPGLLGKIEPIHKSDKTQALYADNIAIEDGVHQPFGFDLNTAIVLEDNEGHKILVTFRFFKGRIALIDYCKP